MKLGMHVGYSALGMGPQDQLAVVGEAQAQLRAVAELAD